MPPPAPSVAVLPDTVVRVSVALPTLARPAPSSASLSRITLSVTVSVPRLFSPPPNAVVFGDGVAGLEFWIVTPFNASSASLSTKNTKRSTPSMKVLAAPAPLTVIFPPAAKISSGPPPGSPASLSVSRYVPSGSVTTAGPGSAFASSIAARSVHGPTIMIPPAAMMPPPKMSHAPSPGFASP